MTKPDVLGHRLDLLRRYAGSRATGIPGAEALEQLVFALCRQDETDKHRLALFRLLHGTCICTVSPLVLDMCHAEGLSLDSLVEQMRPDAPWQRWLAGRRPRPLGLGIAGLTQGTPPHPACDRWRFRRMLLAGLIIRPRRHADGALGIVPTGRSLDMAVRLRRDSGGIIRTRGRKALLLLDQPLPETVQAGLPGRRLDELVRHPLTTDRGYMIQRVSAGGRAIVFHAGSVPWQCPWVRADADAG